MIWSEKQRSFNRQDLLQVLWLMLITVHDMHPEHTIEFGPVIQHCYDRTGSVIHEGRSFFPQGQSIRNSVELLTPS